MPPASSPADPPEKHARLPGCAASLLQLLRLFWVTALALPLVGLYGLYARWSAPRQWSDAFFYAAVAHMFIAAMTIEGALREISAASDVRYIARSDVAEARHQLAEIASRREMFSLRVFIGGLLTLLLALLINWLSAGP